MGLFDFLKGKPDAKKVDLPAIPAVSNTGKELTDEPAAKPQSQDMTIKVKIPPRAERITQEKINWYERKLSPFKSEIVKLVSYSSEEAQHTIGYMKKNDPLYIKKVSGKGGVSFLVFNEYGEKLGKIPAKFEDLCRDRKNVFAVFNDSVFGKTSYQPSIRIFWDIPACETSPVFRMDAINTTLTFCKKLDSYVVLDLETTGFDSFRDEIIEIGMVKIKNGEIASEYSMLVNPCMPIPKAASAVNGIYDEDVTGAPKIHEVIHAVDTFLGDEIIVGHNITFDLRFLKTAMLECGISKEIRYIDTLSVSKSVLPNAKDHKLQTLMEIAGIKEGQSHRALDDAIRTHQVLQYCIQEKIKQDTSAQQERKRQKEAEDAERAEKYSDSPLYNKHFVFTGIFVNDRYELEEMVPNVGALLRTGITKKTDYLVKGDMSDSANWTGVKLSKAEEAIKNGSAIQIIGEQEFLDLIKNVKTDLS